jgi:hypothetical protein
MTSNKRKLNIWTVYHNTKDFPGLYVARRFELDRPTQDHFADINIEPVRAWIHKQAQIYQQELPYRLERQDGDDRVIVEVWV